MTEAAPERTPAELEHVRELTAQIVRELRASEARKLAASKQHLREVYEPVRMTSAQLEEAYRRAGLRRPQPQQRKRPMPADNA